jgi:hypothetical protein
VACGYKLPRVARRPHAMLHLGSLSEGPSGSNGGRSQGLSSIIAIILAPFGGSGAMHKPK